MKRMRAIRSRWSIALAALFVLQTAGAAACVAEPAAAPMQAAQAGISHCHDDTTMHAAMQQAPQTDMSHQPCGHCDAPQMATPAAAFAPDAPAMALLAVPAPVAAQYAAVQRPVALWQTTGPPTDTPLYLTTRRLRI